MSAALPVVTYSTAEEGWAGRQDPTLHTRLAPGHEWLHTEHLAQTWVVSFTDKLIGLVDMNGLCCLSAAALRTPNSLQ